MKTAPDFWYDTQKKIPTVARFLTLIFTLVSKSRRKYFQTFPRAIYQAPVPVIVVGNITVGGTGKTPLVIALSKFLQQQGFVPGVISRGYGGKGVNYPQIVRSDSNPLTVGDEPVLVANQTGATIVVDPKRKRGIQFMLASNPQINVIVADDGLQHYTMGRDIEIVVIDSSRRFGNERLLPAGPLRESTQRLSEVDFCIVNGKAENSHEFSMALELQDAYALGKDERRRLQTFTASQIHAVAGIGNPQRFFTALQQQGIDVIPHSFPDHYRYRQADLQFADNLPVLITEKDAVKCRGFTLENVWVVPVRTVLPETFYHQLLTKLRNIKKR